MTWGHRPLTFVSAAHVTAAAADEAAAVVAELCGCAGGWLTYRAANLADMGQRERGRARVVLTHAEAVEHEAHATRGNACAHVATIVAARVV